jgi:hypothetical protein
MAKRRRKQPEGPWLYQLFENNRAHLPKVFWGIAIILSFWFGYTRGYPLVAQGEIWNGVMIGLAYGGGAFIVISVSYYLNRKLKGL